MGQYQYIGDFLLYWQGDWLAYDEQVDEWCFQISLVRRELTTIMPFKMPHCTEGKVQKYLLINTQETKHDYADWNR